MNEQALREFRVALEFRGVKLNVFKKHLNFFKKISYLVLTNKINIDQAADQAAKVATGYKVDEWQ